jgi:hypothetical protein
MLGIGNTYYETYIHRERDSTSALHFVIVQLDLENTLDL